ncbi:leukemia NUP98 fusion partner 1 [Electrophorus electricus]|uniref:leukemia NUP98 fusion partner 1 n=1 Tax=Electrophorus electricus TaxID=8005 RepID=UPI0015CFC90A|nr:leukemia NUP98 fusion partner 1 [Electrophorus electricus]
MDNEDDDDSNFTKWMSSYWGHGAGEDQTKEQKRSFRRPRSTTVGRRASLPCMSQLEPLQLKHLCTATMPPTPTNLKSYEEKKKHTHPVSSDQNSWMKWGGKAGGSSNVSGLPEAFEMLHLCKHRVMSLSDANNVCLICHEKLCNERSTRGAKNLHYTHRFHKEVTRPGQEACRCCVSSSAICEQRKEVPFCSGREEYRLPRLQQSLRQQR